MLEVLFGKNRAQVGAAILSNFEQAESAIQKMENSFGSADKEMESVKSSIEYKLNSLQQTWVSVAQNLLPTELIGNVVDFANGASEAIDGLTNHMGLLGSIGTVGAGAGLLKFTADLVKTRSEVKGFADALNGIDYSSGTDSLMDYITTLNKISPANRDVVMSMLDLNKGQKEYINSMIDATSALKQLNIGQLERKLGAEAGTIANKLQKTSETQLTDEIIRELLATGELTDEKIKSIIATESQTKANQASIGSFKALGDSIKASFVSMLTTPQGWLTLISIITSLISLISGFSEKAREAREELMETGRAATESGDKIHSLVSNYLDVEKAVESGNATNEEYISAQNALQGELGLTGMRLDELKGKYDNLHDAMLGYAQDRMQIAIVESAQGAEAARIQAVEDIRSKYYESDGVSDIKTSGNAIIKAYDDESKRILEHLKNNGMQGKFQEEFVQNIRGYAVKRGGGYKAPNKITSDTSFEEIWENYLALQNDLSIASEYAGSNHPFVKSLAKMVQDYEDALGDAVEQTDNTNKLIAQKLLQSMQKNGDLPKTAEEFTEFRNSMVESLAKNPDFIGSTDGAVETYVDNVLSQTEATKEAWTQWQKETERSEKIANDIGSKMVEMTKKMFPAKEPDGYDQWEKQIDDFRDKLLELSQDDFNIAYNAVIEGGASSWEEIEAAIRDYNSEQNIAIRQAESLKKTINDLWESEDFEDSRKELMQMAKTIDGITPDAIKELASESDILAMILQEDGMNAEFLASVLQDMALGGSGLEWITPELLALSDALDGAASHFDIVTEAVERYNAAMNQPEKDTNFKSYTSAYEELMNQFEAGTTNSNAFWASAEHLLGSDLLDRVGWSDGLDEIYQYAKNYESVFSDAESAGAGFLSKLLEMSDAGLLVGKNGEDLIDVAQRLDGSWDFDFNPENLEELSEIMNLDKDAILACIEALSMWGDINLYDMNEVVLALEDLGLAFDNAGKKVFNLSGIADEMKKIGKGSGKEIHDLTEMISELNDAVLLDVTGEVTDLVDGLEELNVVSKNGVDIEVNLDSLTSLISSMELTKDEADNLILKLAEVDGIKLVNAKQEVVSVEDAIDHINENATLKDAEEEVEDVGSTADNTSGQINNTSDAIKNLNKQSLSSINGQFDSLKSKVSNTISVVYSLIAGIQSLNRNASGLSTTSSIISGAAAGLSMTARATGTKKASQGPSLVGDEYSPSGKPKPELIVTNGSAYLAGVTGPEIVNLNDGDQVYTADETKKILRGNQRLRISIPAYATGRFTGKGLRIETNKTGATGTAWGNSGNSSTSVKTDVNISTSVDTKTLEEQLEETLKKLKEEIDEIIGDFEHDIFLMEKKGASADEIVAVYRKMQAAVHAQANKYRNLGLAENSDYIQDLQKQWWEYAESIQEVIVEAYESTIDNYKNKITLAENWIDMAVIDKNHGKIQQYSRDIIQYYRRMQEVAHEEAEYLRSQGYSDTSDEVSKLSDLWWDYENEIREVKENVVDTLIEMVSAVDDAIDRLQDVYDTLHDAADEYKEYQGYISVDTFQKIKDLGLEYMQYLMDENDQLVINEDNINKVIAGKTRQLAVENAMAYVERLRMALAGESLEDINQLLFATEETTNATWGLVYASLALLDLSDEQMEAALHNINAFRALGENAANGVGKAGETLTESLEKMKSGLDDILKYVMDMLKQRIQNQIQALEDMKKSYSDIIDMRKKSLDLAREEDQYSKKKANKLKEIAKLQAKIDALSLDDSREAQAERAKAIEELAELQDDLAEDQADKAVDTQKDSLDEMEDAYHAEKDKEIAILEESISSYQKLYDMA